MRGLLLHRQPEIDKQILSVRPSLRTILPIVFWTTTVFAIFNIVIAVGLFFWHPEHAYPSVAPNQPLMTAWAVAYALLGLSLGHGLVTKQWERLRLLMGVGLFYKLFWSVALILRVNDGGTFLIAALFLTIATLQAVIIIFFLSSNGASNVERLP